MSSHPELLSALLDDELDEQQAAEARHYLEESPEAQAEFDGLRKMLEVVSALPPVEAPPDFYEKVAKKLRRRKNGSETLEAWIATLMSMPFQVLSIIIILVIAATYMMIELDRDQQRLEKDPSTQRDDGGETKLDAP